MFFKKLIKSITPDFLLQIYYDYKNKNKTFFGHHNLDQKLCEFLNYKNGFFIELGANDGIRQSNTYNSLGLTDISKKGASRKRFYKFLKLLEKENLISSKKTLRKLSKIRDSHLDIDDGNKANSYKKIFFPYYWQLKQIILKINFIFFFLFLKKDYEELFNKLHKYFNYTKVYNLNIKNNLK